MKAAIKITLPVEVGAGYITVVGHTHLTMSEVIAAAMTKFYKGQGVGEESEEMKSLIRNACETLVLATDKGMLPKDNILAHYMDPKADLKQAMLKFEFKLVRTREVTEEERKAVETAKQAKLAADAAALQEAKERELAELADAQDDTKFEGPQSATVDELVARMLDSTRNPELELRSAFILNHVNFISDADLLAKIVECYERPLPRDEVAPRSFFVAKQRILEFMRSWIEDFPEDFRALLEEHEKFKQFLTRLGTPDSVTSDPVIQNAVKILGPTFKGLTDAIDGVKLKIHYTLKTKVSRVTGVITPPTLVEYPPTEIPADRMGILLTANIDDVVTQINRIDYNCLSMINMRELTNKWWTRKKPEKCPNVTRMIDMYNQRSYWVASACLTPAKPEDRAICIGFFIKLTRGLLSTYNFFGANAILSGLSQSPLGNSRIKATWEKVSAAKKALYEEIKVECDRKKNFQFYRTAYAQAVAEGKACIPNLVVLLQDLYQLEELPTILEANGHVNWHKYGKEWRQAQKLVLFQISQPAVHAKAGTAEQEKEYRRLGSALITVWTNCCMDEEQLWDLSYIHEPKNEEHKLTVQWKGYTAEQKQAAHEEELKKAWLVWGPILEARRQRFEKDRLLREEENAKIAETMKRLNLMRTEWTKDEKKGGAPMPMKAWNDPCHAMDPHVMPDYLSLTRPSSRPQSLMLEEAQRSSLADASDAERSLNDVPSEAVAEDSSSRSRNATADLKQRTLLSPGGESSLSESPRPSPRTSLA